MIFLITKIYRREAHHRLLLLLWSRILQSLIHTVMAALLIVGFRNLRVGFHNRHAIDSRSHNLRADFQDLPVDFHSLLQCRFLLPEERVKGTGLNPEVIILSRLALRIIREKDSPVRVGKAIDLVISSQERLLVTDKFKICRIGLEAQGFLKIFTDFKILIILLINLLRTPLILMTPAVNPEAHQTMVE